MRQVNMGTMEKESQPLVGVEFLSMTGGTLWSWMNKMPVIRSRSINKGRLIWLGIKSNSEIVN